MQKSKIFLSLFSFLLIAATLSVSSSALAATKTTVKTATKTVAKTTVKKTAVKPVLNGQVVSATAKKVVVKSGTKNYNIDVAKTKVSRQTTATTTKTVAAKDLKKGETVSVFGALSKTKVTATSIIAGSLKTNNSTSTNPNIFSDKKHGTSTPPVINHASGTPEFSHNGNHASGTPEFNMADKGLFGTVTTVNDSSLTVTSMGRGEATSSDFYTVTLSSATVYSKDQTAATISDIAVGSKIMISGDVDNTNKTVTATKIDVITKEPDQSGFQNQPDSSSQQ